LVQRLPEQAKIINIGSGNFRLNKKIINLDKYPYKNVDIIATAEKLPFKDSSCQGAISIVLSEHLKQPHTHIEEIFRVLESGGLMYAIVPFIVGYHSAPFDYYRWTEDGVKQLFKQFQIIEFGVAGGPTSGFLWIFQEWIAILLSFNCRILYKFLLMLLMLVTFPVKFLDLILSKYRFARKIASSFYVLVKK
jgi:SAM-dependent methyltransferase